MEEVYIALKGSADLVLPDGVGGECVQRLGCAAGIIALASCTTQSLAARDRYWRLIFSPEAGAL